MNEYYAIVYYISILSSFSRIFQYTLLFQLDVNFYSAFSSLPNNCFSDTHKFQQEWIESVENRSGMMEGREEWFSEGLQSVMQPEQSRYINSVSDLLLSTDEIEFLLEDIRDLEPTSCKPEDIQVFPTKYSICMHIDIFDNKSLEF